MMRWIGILSVWLVSAACVVSYAHADRVLFLGNLVQGAPQYSPTEIRVTLDYDTTIDAGPASLQYIFVEGTSSGGIPVQVDLGPAFVMNASPGEVTLSQQVGPAFTTLTATPGSGSQNKSAFQPTDPVSPMQVVFANNPDGPDQLPSAKDLVTLFDTAVAQQQQPTLTFAFAEGFDIEYTLVAADVVNGESVVPSPAAVFAGLLGLGAAASVRPRRRRDA